MGSLSPLPGANPSEGLGAAQQFGTMQMGLNQQAQQGSMVNQQNPFGGMQYVQTGVSSNGTPIYTNITSLSPQQQDLLSRQIQTQLLAGSSATPLLASGGYASGSPSQAIGSMAGGMTGDMLKQEVNYLDPFFNLQKQQEQAQLANQGFTPDSTAWRNAMLPLDTSQGLTVSNFLASAFPTTYGLAQQTYKLPLDMSQQLAQWGAPTLPGGQFIQTPQLAPANISGAYGTAEDAAIAAQKVNAQNQQNMLSGLFGIGEAGLLGLGLSDVRLKDDIVQVAQLDNGMNLYRYRYKWSDQPYVGVMAQEVAITRPDAVVRGPDGYLRVNYSRLGLQLKTWDEWRKRQCH